MTWVEYDGPGAGETLPACKFAALSFAVPSGPSGSLDLPSGDETVDKSVPALLPESERSRLRERLGPFRWDVLERAERTVIGREAVTEPLVLGSTEARLRERVFRAWEAFLLTGEAADSSAGFIVIGEAESDRHGSPLRTAQTIAPLDQIVRPVYRGRDSYNKIVGDRLDAYWRQHKRYDDRWFKRWTDNITLLLRVPRPLLLDFALLAYRSAWTRAILEFWIPEFVRAAEGILALPADRAPPYPPRTDVLRGRDLFRERALHLVPGLRQDEYVGTDLESLLKELYVGRNDCVHGKVPFENLKERGDMGWERACQLAYVAEVLARESLLVALRHPDWNVFGSRGALESAWAAGAFP
jgi:hypothetical protein